MANEATFRMTPLKLEILMHYHRNVADRADDDPAVKSAVLDLLNVALLERTGKIDPAFTLAERGRTYVEAVLATPLPVPAWKMPPVEDWQKAS